MGAGPPELADRLREMLPKTSFGRPEGCGEDARVDAMREERGPRRAG